MNIEAKCACGDVRFKSTSRPVMQLCCHCLDCQDSLKKEYATIAFFQVDSTKVSGIVEETFYRADSGGRTVRQLCAKCRTVMFDKSESFPTLIGVMTDQMRAPFIPTPSCHVWVDSKSANVSIPADIRQYARGIE